MGYPSFLQRIKDNDLTAINQELLKSGINAINDNSFAPALIMATALNRPLICKQILDAGGSVHQQDLYQFTALHVAVEYGYFHLAELLLQYGANPNHKSKDGNTPLHIATKHNNERLIMLLLQYGADPKLKNKTVGTAAQIATNKELKKILRTATQINPIQKATALLEKNELDGLEDWLLETTVLNAVDLQGDSLLHLAVQAQNFEVIDLLISYHANLNIQNAHGQKPADITTSQVLREKLTVPLEKIRHNSQSELEKLLDEMAEKSLIEVEHLQKIAEHGKLTHHMTRMQIIKAIETSEDLDVRSLGYLIDFFNIDSIDSTSKGIEQTSIYLLLTVKELMKTETKPEAIDTLMTQIKGEIVELLNVQADLVQLRGMQKVMGINNNLLSNHVKQKSYIEAFLKKSYNISLEAAKRQNARGMTELAIKYLRGAGVKKNFDRACYWYMKAYQKGLYHEETVRECIRYLMNDRPIYDISNLPLITEDIVKIAEHHYDEIQQVRMDILQDDMFDTIQSVKVKLQSMLNISDGDPRAKLFIAYLYDLVDVSTLEAFDRPLFLYMTRLCEPQLTEQSFQNILTQLAEEKLEDLDVFFEKNTYEYVAEYGFEDEGYSLFGGISLQQPCPFHPQKQYGECCATRAKHLEKLLNEATSTHATLVQGDIPLNVRAYAHYTIAEDISQDIEIVQKVIETSPTVVNHLYLIGVPMQADVIAHSKDGRYLYHFYRSLENDSNFNFEQSSDDFASLNAKQIEYVRKGKLSDPNLRKDMRSAKVVFVKGNEFYLEY